MDLRVESRAQVRGREPRRNVSESGLDRTMNAYDARAEVGRVSRRPPNEKAELRAFLESKRRMIRANLHLTRAERAAALANIDQAQANVESAGPEPGSEGDGGGVEGGDDDPPLPGGIGLGVFYRSAYKTDFETGTAAEYTILCPTVPGGDVRSWLYLTATNRASLSAEALIAYEAQRECVFRLYDWSRQDRWQVPMTYSELQPYLHGCVLNGEMHQALRVLTITYQLAEDSWRNEVFLENASTGQMGLIYVRAYEATTVDQQDGWNGSWGPIVETFQNRYYGTEEMGFADFSVCTRRGDEWGPWERLAPADTFVAQDDTRFRMLYLEPNHTFLAAA